MKRRILLVEDDSENRRMLREALTSWGYEVTDVSGGADAIRLGEGGLFDVVLTDIRMPDPDGLEVLKAFRRRDPATQVIMMTGFGSIDTAVEAIKAGAFDYLSKPFKFDEIRLTLQRALEQREILLAGGGGQSRGPSAGPVVLRGHSRAMAEIYKTIAKVAAGRSTVLIQGESGTGKELVARAIHRHSEQAPRPFVTINCAAVPETLLETELFGYARGAHSTATTDKAGLFEVASGGTLFLDEIGDTSPGLQAKLLRVLEDSETRRLGDTRVIRVDVRIIASTNQDLPARVRENRFRNDLFYRLNVVSIHLPPLRERKDDIPELVAHFIRQESDRLGKHVNDASPGVLELLQAYSWPGNVRELEHAIERAVLLNTKSTIMPEDLPESIRSPSPAGSVLSLQELERQHIEQVLQQTRGNIKAAAELLGIDRKTLYRKVAQYHIEVSREAAADGE